MNELLTKAHQTAQLLQSDLREAHRDADHPALEILLRQKLADVNNLVADLQQLAGE